MELFDLTPSEYPWQGLMRDAVAAYIRQACTGTNPLADGHTQDTPDRVVRAFAEYVKGSHVDPASFLQVTFPAEHYDEMVHVKGVKITSSCAHHLCPIVGKAHFAYVPADRVVGLSKIPRMIKTLAKRLQVQENLTQQIVDIFQTAVQPMGCAVHIRAYHFCMMARGVEEPMSYTETTAFTGCFKENQLTREEFLLSIDRNEVVFP